MTRPLVLPMDIARLRGKAATKDTHVTIRRLTLLTLLDEIERLGEEVETRDRVIARLLDGWDPQLAQGTASQPKWRRDEMAPDSDFNYLRPVWQTMSDGEAAIIRAHQEAQK